MKAWQIIGIIALCIFGLLLAVILTIGIIAPETSIYLGREAPKRYLKEIRALGLLKEDETIQYFYSDSLYDIKDGMYFVTNHTLTVYDDEWENPAFQIALADIDFIDAQYNDAFIDDSWIRVTTSDGGEVESPLSSEKKRDRLFVEHIEKHAPLLERLAPERTKGR